MQVIGPVQHVREESEKILRSLPRWFGIEFALIEYAEATNRLPTFVALSDGAIVGFATLERHSEYEYEIHCIAVRYEFRNGGIGTALVSAAEAWMKALGGTSIVVKTIAENHPSPEYRESRGFYQRQGFMAEKIIPDIWGPSNPCLQMRKEIQLAWNK